MDTISPLIPVRPIGSSTTQADNKRQGYQPRQGQTVQAVVTKALTGKVFELDINGSKLTAKTDELLKPGQTLELKVIKTDPQIELQVVRDNLNQSVGKSLSLLGKNFDIASLFNRLNANNSGAFSQLSKSSRQTLTSFISLQNNTAGLQSETGQINQVVERLTSLLNTIATAEAGQKALSPKVLQQTLSPLAAIFKGDLSAGKTSPSFQQLLSREQDGALSNLAKVIHAISTGKEPEALIHQVQDLLGINFSSLTPQQIPLAANNLQNNLFAMMHLLKGGNTGQQAPDLQETPYHQSSLSQKDGGEVLKKLINKMGLQFESLLAKGDANAAARTLKAALLEIAQQFQQSKHIAEPTNRLLGNLEFFQQAQLQFDNDRQMILPLPIPFLEQGYIVVDQNGENDSTPIDKDKDLSFSLHLSMKELGNIRVDFHSTREGLYLKFNCESDQKATFITNHQEELKKNITTKPLLGLSFGSNAEDPTTELIRRLVPEGKSLLKTKI